MLKRWMQVGLLCCLCGIASLALAARAGLFSEEVDTPLYDCTLVLQPAERLPETAAVRLLLEAEGTRDAVLLTLTPKALLIETLANGKKTAVTTLTPQLVPGTAYRLTVLRRGGSLGVLQGETFLYRGDVRRAPGAEAAITADKGWTVDTARIQRLEPVVFADNFMRTADEAGSWVVRRGEWALKSAWDEDPHGNTNRFTNAASNYAQNPFAWSGRAATGSALCSIEKPFWEDYTFTAAVRPARDGAVGAMVNMPDAQHGLLVRWSPVNDRGATGNRLQLLRVADGKSTVLKEDRGGYLPGQWYRLAIVSTLSGVRVLLDGKERLAVDNVSPWRGGVGLYTEGAGATFDDITVYGHTLKTDLLAESQMVQINDRFKNDPNGMEEWATTRSDWTMMPGTPYARVHQNEYFGDHWEVLTVRPNGMTTGTLALILNSNGKDLNSGCRAEAKLAGNPPKLTYTLAHDATVLATKTTDPLDPREDYSFRFRRTGNELRLEVDGTPVLTATDPVSPTGQRPAYRAEGCFMGARDAVVLGRNLLDYSFADAPVDWLAESTWQPTTRWACAPHWSFLAGWGRGDAALWHKQRFTGDHAFEAFIGLKMEYPREREMYEERYRDFAIAICGDGINPRSGYAAIYLPSDATNNRNRIVLLRNGIEKASTTVTDIPNKGSAHRKWFNLELKKRGDQVEFYLGSVLQLSFKDPAPLAGGVPAIWTTNNGISVARVRIHFAQPPVLRTDPQIVLDDPWYPEWANLGKSILLDFPDAVSTTGKPVTLQVAPVISPDGEAAPAVNGTRVTFTPKVLQPFAQGRLPEHWFRISATDGTAQSPSFQLALPVFDPALGRDDAHALLLYRFDEGDGKVVHDRSAVAPAVDLSVITSKENPQAMRWLPGQGIARTSADGFLMSAKAANKLMAIQQTKACTLECWLSTDTVYPPTGWKGAIFSWEGNNARNIGLGHHTMSLLFTPNGGQLMPNGGNGLAMNGLRTSLQHVVVTWDGTTTRMYANGIKLGERGIPWRTEAWKTDAPLLLGKVGEEAADYMGTYYLVAIHDRCLSDADILRHYKAGPSAR